MAHIKVTGKEKEEKIPENVKTDTLGVIIRDYGSLDLQQKKSLFVSFSDFTKHNLALATASVLVIIVFVYMLAFYSKMTFFHICAFGMSAALMIWIGASEDARLFLKMGSIFMIFVGIMIFITITV